MTPKDVQELNPDLLVIAVGSQLIVPPIPGRELSHVYTLSDLVEDTPELGQKVVVIGGGLSGCEEALDLAQHGKQVILVEAMDNILLSLGHDDYLHKKDLLDEMEHNENLTVYCHCSVSEITADHVICCDTNGERQLFKADNVILACGTRPLENIVNDFRAVTNKYIVIGDCYQARNLRSALQEGFLSVLDI